jgi:pantoate--beta-alanine ligase
MKIFRTIAEMRSASRDARGNQSLGFVPTMGALHEGHLSLVRMAKSQCEVVAASIFVNPTQFGPNEDFAKYPRTFERDYEFLEKTSVDILFAPTPEEMYPKGAVTWVTVEELSDKLCGRSRPGHFRGVATVVSKLFHIVEPDAAFFGQKDAAQLAIIRRITNDLNFSVKIVGCPIVREADGLAMSSRNVYLNAPQRKQALALHRSLIAAESLYKQGEHNAIQLINAATQVFEQEQSVSLGSLRLDYIELVDPETLDAVQDAASPALLAIAAFVGTTRLIDNVLLCGA